VWEGLLPGDLFFKGPDVQVEKGTGKKGQGLYIIIMVPSYQPDDEGEGHDG